jgi:hypothetical protein
MSAAPRRWPRLAESASWPGAITGSAPSCTPVPRRSAKSRHLAAAARAIEAKNARATDSLGFIPRILIQATLPHSRPRSHDFERVNGHVALHMYAPPSVGLPYGSYPRLVLAWLTTQAVRTRSRELTLGPALSAFMHQLGLTPVTGRRGTKTRLADQLHRLFSTTIRWTRCPEPKALSRADHLSATGYALAHCHDLWWSARDPAQQPLWNSTVTLGGDFFDEILRHSVPVDLRALKALRRSPLALDIYPWLTHRLSYLRRPSLIPWLALEAQFGADYRRRRDFRRRFLARLADVLCVYPRARCSQTPAGLLLKPSPPHVGRR